MIKKIGIIGFGNMGSAIYSQLLSRFASSQLYVCDRHKDKIDALKPENVSLDYRDIISKVDIIILAIKPQSFLNWQKETLNIQNKLVISVMAGITVDNLKNIMGCGKVARAMPNLGVQVGQGVIGWFASSQVTKQDKNDIEQIFINLGLEIEVDQEEKLNSITALSGSGPAYFYYLCELIIDKAHQFGFTDGQARKIAEQTFIGSAMLLKQGKKNSVEWREAVTSKGGTTEAALQILMAGEFKNIFFKAIDEARKKAGELGKV
jgi:pyrroline-5-carboxylate reductase